MTVFRFEAAPDGKALEKKKLHPGGESRKTENNTWIVRRTNSSPGRNRAIDVMQKLAKFWIFEAKNL